LDPRTFADSSVEIHEIMMKGDRVMGWMTMSGAHFGGLLLRLRGIEPTGKPIACRRCIASGSPTVALLSMG
jgi:hypothetical protein